MAENINIGKEAYDKGLLLFRSNELSKAEKKFLTAVKNNYNIADSYFKLAIISVFGDNVDEEKSILKAITLLDKVIESDPIYCNAYSFRAELKSRLGFNEAGLVDIDVALKLFPDSIENLIRKANILLELSDFDKALKTINRAREHEPNNIEAAILCACILLEMEKDEEGKTLLWELLANNKNNIDLMYKVISIYSLFNLRSEAINACKLIIKHNPNVFQVYELLIDLLLIECQYAEAVKVMNKCEVLFSNSPELIPLTIVKVKTLTDLHDYDNAFSAIKELEKLGCENKEITFCLGYIFCAKGEKEKGIKAYSKVLKVDPNHFEALLGRGKAYFDVSKHSKAKADLLKAFDLNNTNKEYSGILLTLLVYDEEYKEANEYFLKIIDLPPYSVVEYLIYSRILTIKKQYSTAISALNLAFERDISDPGVIYIEKARVYLEVNELQNAYDNLKFILEHSESYPEVNFLMAVCLYRKKDFSGAIYHCEIEIEQYPKFAESYCLLGELYYVTHNYEDTIKYCTMAINLKNGYTDAHYFRGLAFLLTKEYELAKNDFVIGAELGHQLSIEALSSMED